MKFSIYLHCLHILLLCFWSHCWEAVRPHAPEKQQQQQRQSGHAGLCLPSQLKESDGSHLSAAPMSQLGSSLYIYRVLALAESQRLSDSHFITSSWLAVNNLSNRHKRWLQADYLRLFRVASLWLTLNRTWAKETHPTCKQLFSSIHFYPVWERRYYICRSQSTPQTFKKIDFGTWSCWS